jgi:hypothetical protein
MFKAILNGGNSCVWPWVKRARESFEAMSALNYRFMVVSCRLCGC